MISFFPPCLLRSVFSRKLRSFPIFFGIPIKLRARGRIPIRYSKENSASKTQRRISILYFAAQVKRFLFVFQAFKSAQLHGTICRRISRYYAYDSGEGHRREYQPKRYNGYSRAAADEIFKNRTYNTA